MPLLSSMARQLRDVPSRSTKHVRAKLVRQAVAVGGDTADAAVVATDAVVVEAAAAVTAAAIAVRARRRIDNSYQSVGASRLCIKIFVSNEIAQDEATTARASSDVLLKTQTEEPLCQTNPPKILSRSRSKEAKTLQFRQFPSPPLAPPQAPLSEVWPGPSER